MADRVSHDQNFNNLILDYPREALVFFVPAEMLLADEAVEIIPARQEQLQRRLDEGYRELVLHQPHNFGFVSSSEASSEASSRMLCLKKVIHIFTTYLPAGTHYGRKTIST